MKIIDTQEKLLSALSKQRLNPPHVINTSGYGDLGFECGCGSIHSVNGYDVERIATALPVKAIYRCSTHYTFIHIKGIFRQKCISEWSASSSLFKDVIDELGLS